MASGCTSHSRVLHRFLESVNSFLWVHSRIPFPSQPSTYSQPLTPQTCPQPRHKAHSHRAKARRAAEIKPKPSGIRNEYQWDKEISEHIHKECFFMVLFSVSGTASRLCHILKLLPWQSVLFYWLWSTLLCLSHVNDQGTKERAHSSPQAQSRQHWGLSPLTHAIYAAWEGISLRKPRSLGAEDWSLETFRRSPRLSESQGKKNTQWWSPCFCFKARIILCKFCIFYLRTRSCFQASGLV